MWTALCIALVASAATNVSALTYNSTFTWYGSDDKQGSPNCQTSRSACNFSSNPGFAAAVSQNIFGVGSGKGAGPYCGRCLRLNAISSKTGENMSGFGKNIVVMVNNLCPADGNPLCAQEDLSTDSMNEFGGVIDVNLCSDDGGRDAIFGSTGLNLAVGTAEEVDCATWVGSKVSIKDASSASSQAGTGRGSATGPGNAVLTKTPTSGGFEFSAGAGRLEQSGLLLYLALLSLLAGLTWVV